MHYVPETSIKTLKDVLAALGFIESDGTPRVQYPAADFDPSRYEVVADGAPWVSASAEAWDRGRLFRTDKAIFSWSEASTGEAGHRFALSQGWSVCVGSAPNCVSPVLTLVAWAS